MATLWAVEEDLLKEVSSAIANLSPAYKGTKRFQRYKGKADDVGKFEDAFIGPRQFKIVVPGQWVREYQTGFGYMFPLIEYQIMIQYPTGEQWDRAIHDDTARIIFYLLNHATAVSGVQLRIIKPETPIESIKNDMDNYQTVTLVLQVHYEVTYNEAR